MFIIFYIWICFNDWQYLHCHYIIYSWCHQEHYNKTYFTLTCVHCKELYDYFKTWTMPTLTTYYLLSWQFILSWTFSYIFLPITWMTLDSPVRNIVIIVYVILIEVLFSILFQFIIYITRMALKQILLPHFFLHLVLNF